MLLAFIKDLKQEVNTMNAIYTAEENRSELKVKLIEFVEFHNTVKEMVRNFTGIYEFIFLVYFLWSNLTICSTLLMTQFELSKDDTNFFILIVQIGIMFWSFFIIFLFCYFGENITSEFTDLNDHIYHCDWHLFPRDIQRMLPILLINTQRPVILKGFGNILCTHENFKTVANRGYSFFMILREYQS
ncbi:odorant receptor coreceptor-like [Contarinia nasturtii]|uniref:odorant receptor coreceptor-like n=1 Tax=Contarinia nasturtii TaxID=265458 RepID=UPI0012D3B108|nr:odorant receptor coreceptor-like [Contarinia nasturtii]